MFLSKVIASSAFLLAVTTINAFAPLTGSTRRSSQVNQYSLRSRTLLSSTASPLMEDSSLITPEGYGFSAPVRRILNESQRGFHKARASDTVIDVMQAITAGDYDVALVYDGKDLVGLFTETDYIRFSTERSDKATTEKESAEYLVTAVKEYVTPASELLTLSPEQTANVAIATMKRDSIRHLLVADPVKDQKLTKDSSILGVISLQDVMSCIQKDERLSLQSLAQRYPNMSIFDQYREQIKSDANKAAADPETVKKDVLKFGTAALFGAIFLSFLTRVPLLEEYSSLVMIGLFILGYIGIIFEEVLEFNKAGIALLMSTGLWITYADFYTGDPKGIASEDVLAQLKDQLAEVSDICFFLLAASAIVEVVDAHQGFKVVTNQINTTSKKSLFWIIGVLTFFLSSILNNLTVTIVMVSLLRKLIPNDNDRRLFGAMVVVAANAGGVWTPIGDVTTTMLWINHQLSTIPTVTELFIPSFVCLAASLAFLVGKVEEDGSLENASLQATPLSPRGKLVFASGIISLLSVPIFAELTGLPPYLAMLTGLGAMWTLTDIIHLGEDEEASEQLKLPAALERTDIAGILFFLGILMSIGVLDKSGLLKELAVYLSDNLPSLDIIATVIGLASALIDNVPLVAATMGMYDLTEFGTDDRLWQLIALCAGTGGSILVIGSASGVALMGLEKVDFLWYAKNVSIGAAVGYFAGIATYLLQDAVLHGNNLLAGVLPQAAVATDLIQSQISTIL